MQYNELGRTGIKVSRICLGTMTWGEQNTQVQAHEQLDYALSQGVNFIDTAEMYPVPPNQETYTTTEQYIGAWIQARGRRDDIVLASKIAGPTGNNNLDGYIRGGNNNFSRAQIAYRKFSASAKSCARAFALADQAWRFGLRHRTAQDTAGQSPSSVGRCAVRFGGRARRAQRDWRDSHRHG